MCECLSYNANKKAQQCTRTILKAEGSKKKQITFYYI